MRKVALLVVTSFGLCLFRFDLLARLEPPPGASVLKLERWPTTALRKRAARPNLPRMQGLTAHLLRHHQA
jgi:hypothetical protein